jgi:hypothetical protein
MSKALSLKSQQALDQYLALLHNLAADDSNLLRRKTFITALMRELERIPHDGRVYGALVDEKLNMFTQPELRHFYQITAREFYWFWSEDEQKIDAMYRGELISVNPFTIVAGLPLEEQHRAASDYYSAIPKKPLEAYATHLTKSPDAAIRLQWATTLLYTFKDFDQEDFTYRAAADTLLNMMDNRTMKQSFLVVVRDFHPIWQKNR